ncbi:Pimeloyl-ACP methyl ester carboxylesterase [Clostridium cavendishii DSM 21758]|uniref:Pimeloyl-ACP methyl ester carboxylesterase n=1 Tax=Clostridium cavendishii DSM 21758 TaxID=1121302 RepID=A0A1M6U915_9CLOT|nr:alpha/beta hydrolase [Clostridium cavendishii]SHK65742.1 Pimeloyl-ACP methyl ester carboxylesterase [Clostridium cavendishii DSM 21758]
MRFLPYSNSFHKIKIKKNIKPLDIVKTVAIVVAAIFLFGIGFQVIKDKVDNIKIKPRGKFVRIDGNKYYYNLTGSGDYTVVMDSSLGAGSYEWQKVRQGLNKNFNCRVFTYDRAGYGFSDFTKGKSVEDQARLLKMILKKAGIYNSIIFVGEEYGSLVATNYEKFYGDSVAGMVLVNPINENSLSDGNLLKRYNADKTLRSFQKKASYVGINEILDKMGKLKNPKGIDEFLTGEDKLEFNMLRRKTNYNNAYLQEVDNLNNYNCNSQKSGLIKDKPLVLIVNEGNQKEQQLALKDLLKQENVDKKIFNIETLDNNTDITALENPDAIITAIKFVFNKCKK